MEHAVRLLAPGTFSGATWLRQAAAMVPLHDPMRPAGEKHPGFAIGELLFMAAIIAAFAIRAKFSGRQRDDVLVHYCDEPHRVTITPRNGMWYTPFPTQKDPAKLVFRKKHRDAVKAVKSCMANPRYQPVIEQLIAEGTIKREEVS